MKKKLKLKGMAVPRIFTWFLGFTHGFIFKTAALDPGTGYVCSSYITGKCKLFQELSSKRIKQLEQELKEARSEAFWIMTQEGMLRKKLQDDKTLDSPVSIDEKRKAERCVSRRASYLRTQEENIKRLGEIDSKIRSCELDAKEELDAVAAALQSRFSTYTHGMLLRPVQSSFIPPVNYEEAFYSYEETHKEQDEQLRNILKEVLNYGKREKVERISG